MKGFVAAFLLVFNAAFAITWGPVTNISLVTSHCTSPVTAVDPNDNGIAVWFTFYGPLFTIQAAKYTNGVGWAAPETISDTDNAAFFPAFALDSNGNATAIWAERDSSLDYNAKAAELPFGGNWTVSVKLDVDDHFLVHDADIQVDGAGNALAVWSRSDGKNFLIRYADRPFGGAWSQAGTISVEGEDGFGPHLGVNAAGDAVVVWECRTQMTSFILASTRAVAGNWTAPLLISSGEDSSPKAGIDPNGNAVAVWVSKLGDFSFIQAATLPSGGKWTAALNISEADNDSDMPVLGVAADGNTTVAWVSSDLIGSFIKTAQLPFGESWGEPVAISDGTYKVQEAAIALASSGSAVAIWTALDADGNGIVRASERPADQAWQPIVNLTSLGIKTFDPNVSLNENGVAIASWVIKGVHTVQASVGTP